MLEMLEDRMMVNQINDSVHNKPIDSESRLKAKQQQVALDIADNTSASASDTVTISDTSKHIEALKASVKDVPEVDAARVLYFRSQIESGQYQVNSDKIAISMLNNNKTE